MPHAVCCQLINSSAVAVCQVALTTNLPTTMIQLCPEQILRYNNFLQLFFFSLNFKCICTFLQVGSDDNTFYTWFYDSWCPHMQYRSVYGSDASSDVNRVFQL